MDLEDVRIKWKRKNQILFSRESQCLQGLLQQIRLQKHRTLVLWAFACSDTAVLALKEKYPDENRPEIAITICKQWAKGKVKMPEAKKALLAVHAIAKEVEDPVTIALCHAIGHACATVHVETHAIGLVMYELTALVQSHGIDNCEKVVQQRIKEYQEKLYVCAKQIEKDSLEWADFLLNDSAPNKERLLFEKQSKKL